MGLNERKGNMYEFITHTWNTIKGECSHSCSYCYMHRWGKQKPVRYDEKELKTDLGTGNFIFVGSSCDMFANNIPEGWIEKTLEHMAKFDNQYLLQTKNPARLGGFILPDNIKICCTMETNRFLPEIMRNSPEPIDRALFMGLLLNDKYITIEPIMDFDLESFIKMLKTAKPKQVNIGADSGRNNLPEPSKEKVLQLVSELQKFTTIHNKSNLQRLI
jgi:DNA repair photolyase